MIDGNKLDLLEGDFLTWRSDIFFSGGGRMRTMISFSHSFRHKSSRVRRTCPYQAFVPIIRAVDMIAVFFDFGGWEVETFILLTAIPFILLTYVVPCLRPRGIMQAEPNSAITKPHHVCPMSCASMSHANVPTRTHQFIDPCSEKKGP